MDVDMRSRLLGGTAFLLAGIVVLLIGAPGLLGLLLIVGGMTMLGMSIGGHETLLAAVRERGQRRARRRPRR